MAKRSQLLAMICKNSCCVTQAYITSNGYSFDLMERDLVAAVTAGSTPAKPVSNCDSLDFIAWGLVAGTIVEFGGARTFVRRHRTGRFPACRRL
jgi:hypothetical protein